MADEGTRTFLGLHVHEFPNLFIVSGPQGGGGGGRSGVGPFNFTEVLVSHSEYIVEMLDALRRRGAAVVDIHKGFEDSWAAHCADMDRKTVALRDCISYYNGHGDGKPGELAYYGGKRWWKVRDQAMRDLSPFVFTGGGTRPRL